MRTVKPHRTGRTGRTEAKEPAAADIWPDTDEAFETYEIFRVDCPECRQPIALLADEEELPEHALCPTSWDPFGLTVCAGSGRAAAEAPPSGGVRGSHEEDPAVLLTLPAGLDWRMQPFSHAGPGRARTARVPEQPRHG